MAATSRRRTVRIPPGIRNERILRSLSSESETDPIDWSPPKKRTSKCTELATQPEETQDFSKPWKMSDLVLSVEGRKLYVHKAILAIASPVFETMLSSNFKEKNAKEIPLPGKKVQEIADMLRAIYPDCEHAITRQNCPSLLELSCEYQMDKLKERCEKFIRKTYRPRMTTTRSRRESAVTELREEALQYVVMSQQHQLSEEVVERCIATFVSQDRRWESLKTNPFFNQLEPQNSQRILEERVKFLENKLYGVPFNIDALFEP